MFIVLLKIRSNSKLVRLEMKVELKTEGLNSIMVRLERLFKTTLCQFYHEIMARVKTFFETFDFWIALRAFGLPGEFT